MSDALASLVQLQHVTKTYPGPTGGITALADVSLDIARGSFVAVAGPSGCGKSTLLSVLSGIDRVTTGSVFVGGAAVHDMTERDLSRWRGRAIGIVFQFFQLIPTLTAQENVMLPMDFCGTWPGGERAPRAMSLLERLGVADQAEKLPATLSGGQQQRVAIARALANAPALLLADEPTGNLDSRTSAAILDLFASLAEDGQTIVMVTHDAAARRRASRVIELEDGRVTSETPGVPAGATHG